MRAKTGRKSARSSSRQERTLHTSRYTVAGQGKSPLRRGKTSRENHQGENVVNALASRKSPAAEETSRRSLTSGTPQTGPEVDLRALGRRGWTRTTTMLSHGTFAGAQFPAVGCGAGGRSSASSVRSRCVPAPRVLLPVVRSGADLLLARVRWPAEGGGPAPDQAAPLARLRRAVGHSPSDASPSRPSPGESDGHRSPRSCPCGERL